MVPENRSSSTSAARCSTTPPLRMAYISTMPTVSTSPNQLSVFARSTSQSGSRSTLPEKVVLQSRWYSSSAGGSPQPDCSARTGSMPSSSSLARLPCSSTQALVASVVDSDTSVISDGSNCGSPSMAPQMPSARSCLVVRCFAAARTVRLSKSYSTASVYVPPVSIPIPSFMAVPPVFLFLLYCADAGVVHRTPLKPPDNSKRAQKMKPAGAHCAPAMDDTDLFCLAGDAVLQVRAEHPFAVLLDGGADGVDVAFSGGDVFIGV